MAALKTHENDGSVVEFLNSVEDEHKRRDSFELLELMSEVTGLPARMWGDSIIGFGNYRYRYANGREGEWFLTGFSPRKRNLTIYVMAGFEQYDALLEQLGKHSTGKSCLYIKRLEDVDQDILRELVRLYAEHVAVSNPDTE